jgi:opacity protein-like surface antigen
MRKNFLTTVISLFLFATSSFAQDSSLLTMLNDSLSSDAKANITTGTFQATQLINTPTVEAPAKKTLQFLIMHRFGELSDGGYELFGLDNAEIRFGLDYGISDVLSVGVGRSSLDKTFDANFKLKLLRQTVGKIPVSVSFYELLSYTSFPRKSEKPFLTSRFRTAYTSQLLIARKFTRKLSLQVSPALIHFNMVAAAKDKNDVFALGVGGRMKITNRMSIDAEYNILPGNQVVSADVYNSLSLGLDIETGGHVFQLVFTNSRGMISPYYLAKTTGQWKDGNIFFGFNISRVFNFKRKN